MTSQADAALSAAPFQIITVDPETSRRFATIEEVMLAFEATLPQHRGAYRALARGFGAPNQLDDAE